MLCCIISSMRQGLVVILVRMGFGLKQECGVSIETVFRILSSRFLACKAHGLTALVRETRASSARLPWQEGELK